ncbi:unnamed protein product [Fraxinus pennsylvanica]|uniref:Protein kinase domain-containing protein n=1 Tax=Fraxinus pennsylvanica TaxID=56036 RepID=A0AAD2EER6_9LAMI|nr:unnamed protein product [Fraxinus pennsylvanica]
MGRLYDNWERLVEATLRREELREVARNPSVSSISSEFSSPIHDHMAVKSPGGPFEEGGSPQQNGQTTHAWPAAPVLKKRLSHLISMINGDHLEEFSLQKDIKSSSILLDATWTAKVSDFGLSLMGPQDDESLDVYSFGIVLLELLSGPKAIHKNEKAVPTNLVDYVVPYISQDEIHRVLDGRVPPPTPFEIEAVAYVGYLAADCVMPERQDRPPMTEVVNRLDRALKACLEPPVLSRFNTDFSATPRHNHINDKRYNILYSCGCS